MAGATATNERDASGPKSLSQKALSGEPGFPNPTVISAPPSPFGAPLVVFPRPINRPSHSSGVEVLRKAQSSQRDSQTWAHGDCRAARLALTPLERRWPRPSRPKVGKHRSGTSHPSRVTGSHPKSQETRSASSAYPRPRRPGGRESATSRYVEHSDESWIGIALGYASGNPGRRSDVQSGPPTMPGRRSRRVRPPRPANAGAVRRR